MDERQFSSGESVIASFKMNHLAKTWTAVSVMLACCAAVRAAENPLAVGIASHAFDHLGTIGEQADAVAATGGNVIYATGCGGVGYAGLPSPDELTKLLAGTVKYNEHARSKGIKIILGYVCATSIVNLDTFDKNWSPEFRAKFKSPPADWRQQDANGKPLPSWYGGNYNPACMNHPDWREYEKLIVRQQLAAGHDGVFFDNPTVHPQGCYCPHCMTKFSAMLVAEKAIPAEVPVEEARPLAAKFPKHFLRFRATTSRDFLQFIRDDARAAKPGALVTCNNSLNAPGVLFSQASTYGYNIYEMTKAEDLLVVEDMATQPRMLPGGRTLEYGPTLQQLKAISRGLPVVANVLADADNHTPPNLVRLAMAEAAAHDASYLSWPTWPENQRDRMSKGIRPQADLLRENAVLLNDTKPRRDVILFLPFRRWVESPRCVPSELAARLTAANVQYGVVAEDDFIATVTPKPGDVPAAGLRTAPGMPVRQVCLVESRSVLLPEEVVALGEYEAAGGLIVASDEGDWMKSIETAIRPSIEVKGPPTVRAVVRDQAGRTIVHVYNLAIEKVSSFEDKMTPASDVSLRVRVPMNGVKSVKAITADAGATGGAVPFTIDPASAEIVVEMKLASLHISTILVIEP
jgi:hypothetical protein